MGLTHQSTGSSIHTGELTIVRTTPQDKVKMCIRDSFIGFWEARLDIQIRLSLYKIRITNKKKTVINKNKTCVLIPK